MHPGRVVRPAPIDVVSYGWRNTRYRSRLRREPSLCVLQATLRKRIRDALPRPFKLNCESRQPCVFTQPFDIGTDRVAETAYRIIKTVPLGGEDIIEPGKHLRDLSAFHILDHDRSDLLVQRLGKLDFP